MSVPLDRKLVTVAGSKTVKGESFPALDVRWVEDVQFVSYKPPPWDYSDRAVYEEWLERLKIIDKDLHWLLCLPHDKFWCQVVFDESLQLLIDSYLKDAPRFYDSVFQLNEEARNWHRDVHRKVFMACLRMATHKESLDCFITPSVFGDILYENFIYDIPKLLDLCVLYGHGNRPILSKMVGNVFKEQPKYEDDLRLTIPTIFEVFDRIQQKCGFNVQESMGLLPQKLDEGKQGAALLLMDFANFQDVVFYLVDISITLSTFLDVYEPASQTFFEAGFCQKLAIFYDQLIQELTMALKTREFENPSIKRFLKSKLSLAKTNMLRIFHQIISYCCIQPVLEYSSEHQDSLDEHIEEFLQTLTSILPERKFLADYEGAHSVQDDLELIKQSPAVIDEMRLKFIQDAIDVSYALFGKRNQPKGSKNAGGRVSPEGSAMEIDERQEAVGGKASPLEDYSQSDSDLGAGACAPRLTGMELESLIYSIRDVLPDLGDGFIELCLEHFNYDTANVIHALLEDKLPASLADVDKSLKREPVAGASKSMLSERRNIYDYDEFDVFHRETLDMSKVHQGKKDKLDTFDLDDKSHLEDIRETYNAYGSMDVKSMYERNVYEDEYDDTYDSSAEAPDAESVDELMSRRPFTVPRVLQVSPAVETRVMSESEDSEAENDVKARAEFVQNPAELRRSAEERAQSRRGVNTWSRSTGQKTHGVKGKSRGQGQTEMVVKNRQWKEKHKGLQANHNRRKMAEKKRSKGMGFVGPQ